MAADELNLGKDMPENGEEEVAPEAKGGKKKIIILVVAALLIGAGAAFFLMSGGDDAEPEEVVEKVVVEQDLDPIYFPLAPAFVVNYEYDGKVRYVQMELQIMSYHQDVIDKVEANMPAVRNSLIMLFGSQDFDELRTVEGKEKLRAQVKNNIQKVVRLKGDAKVDDVFFTAFVMQ
ncbi:MAG: flagellar basal body-associated FliL family protein [Pseudomonadales bacterium]|nr:flagellar basal body-associated FliL family protein [Pseudomonadales bacterium]MCP5173032.1 flagellar basal body-associated FliL family protein [Pseudomonadales bacterium]MCP5302506.1 flagellar basal body-associated FliL family protein [Pseudomonadales bacterium]